MFYVTTFDIVIFCIEIIFYAFHFSFFIVLCVQKNQRFKGAVYDLFRVIFVQDFMFILSKYLTKLPSFGLWPEYFKTHGYLASLNLTISGYFVFGQFIAHTLIAFNRFTLFWFPTIYSKIWSRQWYTFVVLTLPIFILAHRFPEDGIFQFAANGEVILRMKTNDAQRAIYVVSSIFYFSCTFIQAIFNVLAAFKFRSYKTNNNNNNNNSAKLNDTRLLYISFIFFALQLFRSIYNYIRPYFTNNPEINYLFQLLVPVVADVYAWTGSISLIVLSPSTRKAYFKFYGNYFGTNFLIPDSIQSSPPKITNTTVKTISENRHH